jgi:hypothetical protein
LKTTSMTGRDRTIPHSLDACTADLMIQMLGLARPFAEFAARLVYHDRPSVQADYRDAAWMNFGKRFTTEDITAIMQKYTGQELGRALGVNDWRHYMAASRRKLCPRADQILDGDGDLDEGVDPGVAQFGHNLETDLRTYGRSDDAALTHREDVLDAMLDASTDWQIVVNVIPGQSAHAD